MFTVTIALISLTLAATMTIVTWRITVREQRRSAARIAALAADIDRTEPLSLDAFAWADDLSPVPVANLFDTPDVSRAPRSGLRAAAIVVATAAIGTVAGLSAYRAAAPAAHTARDQTPMSTPIVPAALELVALDHDRAPSGLTVHGIVRNPVGGAQVEHLTAVIQLFDRKGAYLTSGQAAVTATALAPGQEAPFVVTVPPGPDVARYRVSFRADAGVLPHVDRRQG